MLLLVKNHALQYALLDQVSSETKLIEEPSWSDVQATYKRSFTSKGLWSICSKTRLVWTYNKFH